jgi:hypothetical protein
MKESDKITEEQLRKILNNLIKITENSPNNYELGEKIRNIYWLELKGIKEKI